MTSNMVLICVVLLHQASFAFGIQISENLNAEPYKEIVTMNGVPVKNLLFRSSNASRNSEENFPVIGTTEMSAVISGELCTHDYYEESPVESEWRTHALEYTNNKEILCSKLEESNRADWLSAIAGKTAPSTAIFSTLCKRGQAPQLLEPLAGILRSP